MWIIGCFSGWELDQASKDMVLRIRNDKFRQDEEPFEKLRRRAGYCEELIRRLLDLPFEAECRGSTSN